MSSSLGFVLFWYLLAFENLNLIHNLYSKINKTLQKLFKTRYLKYTKKCLKINLKVNPKRPHR